MRSFEELRQDETIAVAHIAARIHAARIAKPLNAIVGHAEIGECNCVKEAVLLYEMSVEAYDRWSRAADVPGKQLPESRS